MQVMYFLNGPMVNLLLICWKWLLKGNWATILHYPWIPNCLEHFSVSVLLMELPKMLKNSCIFKTFSFQTFYEAKVIIQSLPTKQGSYVSRTNIFWGRFTGISRHLKMESWASKNEIVNVSSGTNQKHVGWNICEVSKVFGCVAGAYFLSCRVSWGSQNEWCFFSETIS